METTTDINWIHREIDKMNDANFIDKLKHLLQNYTNEKSDFDYNLDIEKSLKSISEGNYFSNDEAKTISKGWGRK